MYRCVNYEYKVTGKGVGDDNELKVIHVNCNCRRYKHVFSVNEEIFNKAGTMEDDSGRRF